MASPPPAWPPPSARPHGLGFLAAGYKTADGMYQEIKQLRGLTGRPFGVNLFMPQPPHTDPAVIEVYRNQLAGEATWYETPLGDADSGGDDGYEAKLAILREDPVAAVSFTFGCPEREALAAFAALGTYTVVTVTTPDEAQAAQSAGADAVCVQGIEAAWAPVDPPRRPAGRRLRHRAALADHPGPRERTTAGHRGRMG